eukprot:2102362-Pyramimonas_sp.AAC.1
MSKRFRNTSVQRSLRSRSCDFSRNPQLHIITCMAFCQMGLWRRMPKSFARPCARAEEGHDPCQKIIRGPLARRPGAHVELFKTFIIDARTPSSSSA